VRSAVSRVKFDGLPAHFNGPFRFFCPQGAGRRQEQIVDLGICLPRQDRIGFPQRFFPFFGAGITRAQLAPEIKCRGLDPGCQLRLLDCPGSFASGEIRFALQM
jgi:hypothetical protein